MHGGVYGCANLNHIDYRYKNDRQIQAMTALVSAYQRREVHEAEKIIRENRATIMDDPFIREHIDDVLRSLRTQWILDIIKPYTRIEIAYLARVGHVRLASSFRSADWLRQQLSISLDEVEDILVALILDGKIRGQIDQVTGKLELDTQNSIDSKRYASLSKWADSLGRLHSSVIAKSAQSGPGAERTMGGFPAFSGGDAGMLQFGSMGGW
jgi:COP9 signalosome complex subunit 2